MLLLDLSQKMYCIENITNEIFFKAPNGEKYRILTEIEKDYFINKARKQIYLKFY